MMDYLAVGHVCMDKIETGFVLGGSASYCCLYAHALGLQSEMITSYGKDFLFEESLKNISITNYSASQTTIFQNIYAGEQRTQFLLGKANDLFIDNQLISKKTSKIIHLCPLADELFFKEKIETEQLVCMTIQGWLRARDQSQKVTFKMMDFEVLQNADIVVLSTEDLPDISSHLPVILEKSDIVVVTDGSNGATCFRTGNSLHLPAYSTDVVDPTGAGDIFALGFFISFSQEENIHQAMIAGHALASLCVQRHGVENPPSEIDWEERIDAYKKRYI